MKMCERVVVVDCGLPENFYNGEINDALYTANTRPQTTFGSAITYK